MLGRMLVWVVGLAGRRPGWTVALHALLLGLVAVPALHSLQNDPRAHGPHGIFDTIFDNDLVRVWGEVPPVEAYQAFKERYGSDELIVLALRGPGPLDGDTLDRAARLARALEASGDGFQVVWAGDLPYAPDSLVFEEIPSAAEVEAFRTLIAQDPSARRLVRLDEGWDLALVVALPVAGIDDLRRLALADRIEAVTAAQELPAAWRHAAIGGPMLLGALRSTTLSTMARVLPLVNVLIVVICVFAFRQPRVVVVALTSLAQGEALAIALYFAGGYRFNYISAYLITCIIVIGFATNMHLYARYCVERRTRPVADAIREAASVVARPSTVSVGTSCLAFLSLVTADQAAIAEFGLFSAIGMVLVLATAYSLGPALLVLIDQRDSPAHQRPLGVPDPTPLAMACWRRPWPVVGAATAALVLGLVGVTQLKVGSDVRESFRASHPISVALGTVASRFPGVSSYELLVSWPPGAGPQDGDGLVRSADAIQRALVAELPPVAGRRLDDADVVCTADLARSFCLSPARAELCVDGLPRAETSNALLEELPEGVTPQQRLGPEGAEARFTVMVDLPNALEGVALADALEDVGARASGGSARVTGLAPLWNELEATIVRDLSQSFLQGAAVLLGLVVLSVRGVRAFGIVLFLYAFPLAVVTGAAGFLSKAIGYHVNSAVMMYVTVAEGIVVDDVIYFVLGFLHHRKTARSATAAMRIAVEEVGDGVLLTAVCLSAGFLLMLLADITNAQMMGGLTAAAVLTALVGVVCVLPALARLLLCPRGEDVEAELRHP